MSEQQSGIQEARSEPDEPETLDFLKDELEAAGTEHFSFGKEASRESNEAVDTNEQQQKLQEVVATTVTHEQLVEAVQSKVQVSVQKSTEQNGVGQKLVAPPVQVVEVAKEPVVEAKVVTVSSESSPANQPALKVAEPQKQAVVESATKATEPIISPERPPKKPDLHDFIEGSKVPVLAASEQRPPKVSESTTKPTRMKTEPTSKEPAVNKVDDLRQLAKTNFQRKRQTYTKLKEWDEHRAEQLAIHRAVVDDLQASIDRAVKSSLENLQIYTSFLRQKSKQLEKYAAHPAINTRNITQSNEASRSIYINCALLLNSLSDENAERGRKAQNFAQHIRKNILTDNLEEHLKRSTFGVQVAQLELMKIREKISTLKASLQKCNADTEERTVRLATQFNADQNNITLATERDFYKSQLSFLRKAYEQTRVQKRLGELTFEYLRTATDEQYRRAECIKKAITLYVQGLRTSCDVQFDQQSLQQLRKHEEQKLIPQFYAMEELLDGKLLRLVKQRMKLGDRQFDNELLRQFLDKYVSCQRRFGFAEFDGSLLKVKQFSVSHQIARGKVEAGTLLVTVDNFLLLFLESENTQPFSKPAVLFKIDKTLVVTSKGDLVVQLKKKQQKKGVMSYLIWDTKSQPTFTVRFRSSQQKSEFEALIRRLF